MQGSPVTALTMASAPDHSNAAPRPERARAYAKARRHSSFVRLLKLVIPIGAAVSISLVVLITIYNPFGRLGLTLGPISISGTKIAMEGPRLTGFKKDARPYEVTASAAYQDIRKPNVIELKEMKARMGLDATGSAANLVAKVGIFDTVKEHLDLTGDIRIITDKGEEALMQTASVDFKTGAVISKDPVQITMSDAKINADTMQLGDSGKTIAFVGRVHVVLKNGSGGAHVEGASASPKLSQAEPAKP
jgi:lipopolysaccharide export system protein LptC